jgi:small GTP-binding protein
MSTTNSAQKKPVFIFKCPVAGDGAVGKTSLIVRYTQGTFTDTYKMTIGTSFAVKTVDLSDVMVKLQIWDLAGQPHFGGVRPLFYQGSTGVIYVFSVADRASFDHLVGWLEEARKNAGNVPGVLIGNKTDLIDQRVVSREEAEGFANQAGFKYVETSAKEDENVGDAFYLMAVTIMQSKWPEYGQKEEISVPAEPVATEPESHLESVPSREPEPEIIEPIEPPPTSQPEPIPIPHPDEPESAQEDILIKAKAASSLVEFIGVEPYSLSDADFERRAVHSMQRLGVSEVGVLGTFLRSLIRQHQRDVVLESLESLQEDR